MRWTTPNLLTMFRLFAAPMVGFAFAVFARPFADYVAFVLFVAAGATDYLDGYLARRWGQITKFGRMLDPIADKAMVIIALTIVVGLSGLNPWILFPAVAILLREVFVSGLREYLGGQVVLHVTRLAKWKTAVQLVAVGALFFANILQVEQLAYYYAMDPFAYQQVVTGVVKDDTWLYPITVALSVVYYGGMALLWVAALLTTVTGWQYFAAARPHLSDAERAGQ